MAGLKAGAGRKAELCEANAMVGGDNAARAVAIGMVLGAHHGVQAIPQEGKAFCP